MKKYNEFEVSLNEVDWTLNENNVLESVKVVANGKVVEMNVVWNDIGAYVLNGEEKIYILDACN